MAGTLIRMSKIKQVLRLHKEGISNRRIAVELGLYKGTVNDYIRKVNEHGFDVDSLLNLEDPVLEEKFSAGNPAYTDARFNYLKGKLSYFEGELRRAHVTRKTLWNEYIRECPDGYRYSQFCYHLNQLQLARHPSAILEHIAGNELHVDFAGDRLSYVDLGTGEVIEVQVFIGCLPYSNYTFAMAVPSQRTDDFLYALSCCLKDMGGCPRILIPDNLKAAVIKADRYEPELNRVLDDFANHYGFAVLPTRSRKPKDKALVENHVRIIYTRVYAQLRNQRFFSIEALNQAIAEKVSEHNQTRQQQKDYSREEKFLAEEKQVLRPLPEQEFELKYYTDLRVATNNCIYLGRDKHYYSVPYIYIGQKVSVIYTRSLVTIYCQGKVIATHSRTVGFGYTTEKEHLCSTHQHYRDRSPEYYIRLAEKRSGVLGELIKRNFEKEEIPEVIYKRCDGFLSLQRKTDPVIFEKACRWALQNNLLSYKSLQKIIENKTYCQVEDCGEQEDGNKQRSHINIRGKQHYDNHINQQQTELWNRSDKD
ncbi:IS21 family transposase [Dysgonomonas sp. 521]|nr:IS21 family transposase [Dysgonomonas sp. 521]